MSHQQTVETPSKRWISIAVAALVVAAVIVGLVLANRPPQTDTPAASPSPTPKLLNQVVIPFEVCRGTCKARVPTESPSSSAHTQVSIESSSGSTPVTVHLSGGLNAAGTAYEGSVEFSGFVVTDSRPDNSAYSVTAHVSELLVSNTASATPPQTLPFGVGLTDVHLVKMTAQPNTFAVADKATTAAANATAFNLPLTSQNNASAPADHSSVPRTVLHVEHGRGVVAIAGTIRVSAPPNMIDGSYQGTLTLAVVDR